MSNRFFILRGLHVFEVHEDGVVLIVVTADAVDEGVGGVDGGHGWDAQGDSLATEDDGVALWVAAFFGGGDDVVNLATFNKDACVKVVTFVNFVELYHVDVRVSGFDGLCGALGGKEFKALVVEFLSDFRNFRFVLVADGDEDATFAFEGVAGCHEPLIEGFEGSFADAQYFAGGFHFRPELGVHVGKLFKGEDRNFDCHILAGWIEAGAVAEVSEAFSEADAGGQVNHWYAGDLADVWHGTGGTRVHFNDIEVVVMDNVLDVGEPDGAQAFAERFGVVDDFFFHALGDVWRWVNGDGVAGVNAGAFDVFQNPRDEHVFAVGDGVDFYFDAVQIFVDEDWVVFIVGGDDDLHVFLNVVVPKGDDHILPTQYIAWTHEHRITDVVGDAEGFLFSKDGMAGRAFDFEGTQERVKAFAVFGGVDAFG